MNPIKIYDTPFLEPIKNEDLQSFFSKVFNEFIKELNRINVNFDYSKDKMYSVFDQVEMTWVGIFNNAIIKAFPNEATTLLEYAVYDENESKGRADLWVRWGDIDLLFEAKRDFAISSPTKLYEPADYKIVIKQLEKYTSDKVSFKEKLFLVPLFFGRLHKEIITEAKELYKNDSDVFCVFFENQDNDDAAWVYGKVHAPKQ